jgi:hypothetical protein
MVSLIGGTDFFRIGAAQMRRHNVAPNPFHMTTSGKHGPFAL